MPTFRSRVQFPSPAPLISTFGYSRHNYDTTRSPNKNFATAFKLENQKDLNIALENNDILFIFPHQIKLFANKTFDIVLAIDCLHEMEKKIIEIYMSIFEQISTLLYFKVWEYSGLNYSFYERHSVHRKSDYSIKNNWKELLNQRCLYPSKYFELGYEF